MTKDRLKEEIGLFKLLMTIALAILTSIISWFWNNYITTPNITKYLSSFLIIVFGGIVLYLFFKINKKIKELDL